ncbi:MAG: VIT1/CCC1 transporter family protein [Candidatus Andersenbacteria bacterium]
MFSLIRHVRRPKSVRDYSVRELKKHHQEGMDTTVLHGRSGSEYVGDFVFGGIDGVVTTFAVVAGVAGADLSAAVVLVLGLANLLADGFAMGIGNFLSIRSEKERYAHEWHEEAYEIEKIPEHEQEEIRTIYRAKGFSGKTLDSIVATITSDKERWIREMLFEEHGLTPDTRSPVKGGSVTYAAFIIIGFIPLLSFVLALGFQSLTDYTFILSVVLTGFALFTIGALKTLVVARSVWRAGLETLFMGGLAATVAYIVGYLLRGLT